MLSDAYQPATAQGFAKVTRVFSLRSYFKKAQSGWPQTPLQMVQYWKQHGEWPCVLSNTSDPVQSVYEIFEQYNKRSRPYHDQFFTPPAVAAQVAKIADNFSSNPNCLTLDACSGFGMLASEMTKIGFPVFGFDISQDLVEIAQTIFDEEGEAGASFMVEDFTVTDELMGTFDLIVSNPPFTNMPVFLQKLDMLLSQEGTAVLILPVGFLQKTRPSALVSALHKFDCIHAEPSKEGSAQTDISTEICVLKKR